MRFDKDVHHRRTMRLRHYDYSQPGIYFVTICTRNRQPIFGDITDQKMVLSPAGVIVASTWREMPKHYPGCQLDEFIIMPNHFHGLVRFSERVGAIHELPLQKSSRRQMGLAKLVGRFKMVSAKAINQLHNRPDGSVWQRNYFEHIIRSENSYLKIAEYIQTNPQRWAEDTYYV